MSVVGSPEIQTDQAYQAVCALLGSAPSHVQPVAAGANSRVYRVHHGQTLYALKKYPKVTKDDPRDRQETERRALELMADMGIPTIPKFIGKLADRGYSLLEWFAGDEISRVEDRDAQEAGRFLEQISVLHRHTDAGQFPLASEACLSGREILRQIDLRRERLERAAGEDPVLYAFFADGLAGALDRLAAEAVSIASDTGVDIDPMIEKSSQRLVPSDFGYHNALRLNDGSLRFIDFEYFGNDDPVKLGGDFLVHPGITMTPKQKEIVQEALYRAYGDVPGFEVRLKSWTPLLVARWALIMLNIFLPCYQKTRRHLYAATGLDDLKAGQISKTRDFLAGHGAPVTQTY